MPESMYLSSLSFKNLTESKKINLHGQPNPIRVLKGSKNDKTLKKQYESHKKNDHSVPENSFIHLQINNL